MKKDKYLPLITFSEKYNVNINTLMVDVSKNKNPFKYKKNKRKWLINESYILKKLRLMERIQSEAQIFYYIFDRYLTDTEKFRLIQVIEVGNNISTQKAWNQFFTYNLFNFIGALEIGIDSKNVTSILNPQIQTKLWIWWRVCRWILIRGAKLKGKKYNFKELEKWLYKE